MAWIQHAVSAFPAASYIGKTDDDIWLDVPMLHRLMRVVHMKHSGSHTLVGNLFLECSVQKYGNLRKRAPACIAHKVRGRCRIEPKKFSFAEDASFFWQKSWRKVGEAGLRSPYLSHAERAIYQLIYFPTACTQCRCAEHM